jgi:sialic acid synthase SpsE
MFNQLNNSFVIAEIGVNHEGSIETAFMQIDLAKKGGASAVKFQTYKAKKLASKNSPSYWDLKKESTKSQFKLFKKYDSFDKEDYLKLSEYCKQKKIHFSSTPFDVDCLPWLAPLMPFIKIASADLTNDILLEECLRYNKPILLSTGASKLKEINRAVDILKKAPELVLLHCVLNYPTKPENGFLERIKYLQSYFNNKIQVGYSDHISPNSVSDDQIILARGMGVKIFEKHFTHDKTLKGNDHYHAMDYHDLTSLILRLKNADKLINDKFIEQKFISSQNLAIKNARRSLYYNRDLKKGYILTKNDIIPKRPGTGIPVSEIKNIIGSQLKQDVFDDNQVKSEDLI